jgi:hypothetical protein
VTNIKRFINTIHSFFEESIIILDGDSKIPDKESSFMKLPGKTNPELVFHSFAYSLESEAWKEISEATQYGFSKDIFMRIDGKICKGKENRDKAKETGLN